MVKKASWATELGEELDMKSCECCNNKKDFLFKYQYKGKTYYLCEDCDDEIGFLGLQELVDNAI
jgi:hypothetical protein